jgi:CBS-domain-containing membrane protein
MITDRDIGMATHFRGALQGDIPIADVMSSAVRTVGPGESIEVAEVLMRDAQLRRLPVVDSEQRLVGLLSLADLALRTNGRSGRAGATAQGISRTLRAISEPRHAVKLPSHAS